MRVAVLQCDAAGRTPAERLDMLAEAAGAARADLLLCPELFQSGYDAGEDIRRFAEPADGPFAAAAARIARDTGTAIVYGYPEHADGALYNSAQGFGPDGTRLANHRKLAIPPGFEGNYFGTGDRMTRFDLGGVRFGILICYDSEFPEPARAAATLGVQALLVPTALSDQWEVVAHRLVPARAFENGVFVVYANHAGREGRITYLGASCIVGPDGRDLARATAAPEIISADIDPSRVAAAQARLPYLRDVEALRAKLVR